MPWGQGILPHLLCGAWKCIWDGKKTELSSDRTALQSPVLAPFIHVAGGGVELQLWVCTFLVAHQAPLWLIQSIPDGRLAGAGTRELVTSCQLLAKSGCQELGPHPSVCC